MMSIMADDILFEPVPPPVSTSSKRLRYTFEPHDLVTVTKGCEGCDNCDCADCRDGVSNYENEEVCPGWVVIDKKRGRHDPICFVYEADQAQKIVDALNTGAHK
jgi:hypothetical protein